MRIKKIKNVAGITGTIVDNLSTTGEYDVPSVSAVRGNTLFEDSTGNSENITLNDNYNNYKYVEIYGFNSVLSQIVHTKIDTSINKDIVLSFIGTNGSQTRIVSNVYTVAGNILTKTQNYRTTIFNKTITEQGSNSEIYITKIIGYK